MRLEWTNTKALQFYNLCRQGAMIVTSILLAKSRLTVADIGAYEILLFIGYTLSFWWVTGLIQGFLTTYPKLQLTEQKQLLFNVYCLFLIISLLLFLLLILFPSPFLMLIIGHPDVRFFEILLIFVLLNFPTFLLDNVLLIEEKPKEIVIYGIFTFISQPLAVLLPIWMGLDFGWSMGSLVLVAGIKHGWLLLNIWQNGVWQFQWVLIKNLISMSIPLVLYSLMGGFNVALDNWLVNFHYNGEAEKFAIFRYGAQELPLTLALTNALSVALLPEVAKNLPTALIAIRAKSLRLFHFLFPLGIFILMTDRWLFPLVFNPAFIESVPIFNIYLLILISRVIFSRPILIALQANRLILIISVIELFFNAVVSFVLAQQFGMIGVAMGTLVAYTLEKILLCALLRWRFGVALTAYVDLHWFFIYTFLLLAAFFWSMYAFFPYL